MHESTATEIANWLVCVVFRSGKRLLSPKMQSAWRQQLKLIPRRLATVDNGVLGKTKNKNNKVHRKFEAIVADVSDLVTPAHSRFFLSPLRRLC